MEGRNKWEEGKGQQRNNADGTKRNRRTVWSIATEPWPGAHFAVMPTKLVEPCILAGTSERGCCPVCGAPWKRVVERTVPPDYGRGTNPKMVGRNLGTQQRNASGPPGNGFGVCPVTTIGWRPTCDHDAEPVPCTVLDPFAGSGTVGVVALRHGRRFVGLDLSRAYCEMARRRIVGDMPILHGMVAS